jgi:transposase
MKYIDSLTESETNSLQEIIREPLSACRRMRATAILLSDHKISLQSIARISGVCRQAASIWLNNWKEWRVDGLIDKQRSGRPPKLSSTKKNRNY